MAHSAASVPYVSHYKNRVISIDEPGLGELISLCEIAEMSGLSHDRFKRLAGKGEIWYLFETLK